jgi:hypothetical protein
MYKISIDKDNGTPIMFLDAMTFIPAIGPDSDMDGHDLSSLTYNETLEAEDFVENFNEYCANKASLMSFMSMPVIAVKMFYPSELNSEEEDEGEFVLPETQEERDEMKRGITSSWEQLFQMSPAEIEIYWEEFLKRFKK